MKPSCFLQNGKRQNTKKLNKGEKTMTKRIICTISGPQEETNGRSPLVSSLKMQALTSWVFTFLTPIKNRFPAPAKSNFRQKKARNFPLSGQKKTSPSKSTAYSSPKRPSKAHCRQENLLWSEHPSRTGLWFPWLLKKLFLPINKQFPASPDVFFL